MESNQLCREICAALMILHSEDWPLVKVKDMPSGRRRVEWRQGEEISGKERA